MLFGGTGLGAGGKAVHLNDAHVCRIGADGAVAWAPVQAQGPQVGAAVLLAAGAATTAVSWKSTTPVQPPPPPAHQLPCTHVPQPAPRARHTAVPLDGRRLLVWGGLDSKQRFQDLWVLDVTAKQWAAVEAQGTPPPARAHHTGAPLHAGLGGCWQCCSHSWSRERHVRLPVHPARLDSGQTCPVLLQPPRLVIRSSSLAVSTRACRRSA